MIKRERKKVSVSFTIDSEVYEQICKLFWQTRCRSLSEFVNSIFAQFIQAEQTKEKQNNKENSHDSRN